MGFGVKFILPYVVAFEAEDQGFGRSSGEQERQMFFFIFLDKRTMLAIFLFGAGVVGLNRDFEVRTMNGGGYRGVFIDGVEVFG